MMVTLARLHVCALLLRLGLIFYGEWQDKNFDLKFTDVDYHVFADAAKYVSHGQSPYLRPTYRYTPLLAWLLVPCHFVHILWGKFFFVTADMLTGILIQGVLQLQNHNLNLIKIAVIMWLFNPITMAISSRGNAESVMSVLVVGTIYALCKRLTVLSGIIFGLSIHLKIFPAVTSFSIYLLLGSDYIERSNKLSLKDFSSKENFRKLIGKLLSKERLEFFLSSVATVATTTVYFYSLYGYDFLENTYFYHVTRKDIRHNFSIYFYMLYTSDDWWLGVACFFNQVIVTLCLSFGFYKDLPFSSFLLTFSFVTFNKICTSQYFQWYLTLVPLLVPGLAQVRKTEIICAVALWSGAQGVWLAAAYSLEFEGKRVFLSVWLSSCCFYIANVLIVVWFLKRYNIVPSFSCRSQVKKAS